MLAGVTPEQLEARWANPRGQDVIQRVLIDLREEGGLNLPAILSELGGAEEVPSGLDLRYAPLEGAQLEQVNLYEVDLTGANLAGANLTKADVREARLDGALLEDAILTAAYLSASSLTGANLRAANLDAAMLDQADLTSAVLYEASCVETYFEGTRLSEADLRLARLDSADFLDAICEGMIVSPGGVDVCATPPGQLSQLVVDPPLRPSRALQRGQLATGSLPRRNNAAPRLPRGAPPQQVARPPRGGPRPASASGRNPNPNPGTGRGPAPRRIEGASASGRNPTQRPRGSGPARNGAAPLSHEWDLAMARLFPLRGKVSQITIVIDGRQEVIFGG